MISKRITLLNYKNTKPPYLAHFITTEEIKKGLAKAIFRRYDIKTMQIKTFSQFEKFLHSRIPTREALFQGDLGLKRAKYFMKLLGNPQNKLRVIHIAGTSGKGSTAHIMSHVLQSHGFSVGLSISPHVLDIRERAQVFRSTAPAVSRTRTTKAGHANHLPSKKLVLKYFNEILPIILKMEKCPYGMPTFFEINVALAYYMFAKENLNYAVMETGLGGTLDATNTVGKKDKICIITKLGLDHTEILGNTLPKIAEQKAGVIQKQNTVVTIQQSANAMNILKQVCKNKKSQLYVIDKNNYKIVSHSPRETVFNFNFNPNLNPKKQLHQKNAVVQFWNNIHQLKLVRLGLIGRHQAENCSLALACLQLLSKRDGFAINETNLRKSLENIRIPGRFEMRNIDNKTIIIDGAHNPQKMRALIKNLKEIYPNKKFVFLVAFKKSKNYKKMLLEILPLAKKIYLTRFSTKNMDGHWNSTDNRLITEFLRSQNFHNFSIITEKHSNIPCLDSRQVKKVRVSVSPVIITGSLYLVGGIHKYLRTIQKVQPFE